jgi:hypothetical protein
VGRRGEEGSEDLQEVWEVWEVQVVHEVAKGTGGHSGGEVADRVRWDPMGPNVQPIGSFGRWDVMMGCDGGRT